MIAAFHKWEKIKPVSDSAVCYRTFQAPTNRDVPKTEKKRVTHIRIGNVPTNDWPIIIQPQDGNGPGKNKADLHTHRLTTFLPVSVQALLQPFFTFYTNELHQQLPE